MLGTAQDSAASEVVADNPSMFSMDYYRQKSAEFQQVLTALDASYRAAKTAIDSGALTDESVAGLMEFVDDYDSKKMWVKGVAEGINAAAAAINASGGRFPPVSIPGTLGLAPIAAGATLVALVGAIAAIIVWGNNAVSGVNVRLNRAQLIDAATPEQRAQIVGAAAESDNAIAAANSSVLSTIAPLIKWGAVALMAWLAYRAYSGRKTA